LADVLACSQILRAMEGAGRGTLGVEKELNALFLEAEGKLDATVQDDVVKSGAAFHRIDQLTVAIHNLTKARESTLQARHILSQLELDTACAGDFDSVGQPLRLAAEEALRAAETAIKTSEARIAVTRSLKEVLKVGLSTFLEAYNGKVKEKATAVSRYRNDLLRLSVYGRSYYDSVLSRYTSELQNLHQRLVAAEAGSSVNNPSGLLRSREEKRLLMSDIADLGKRVEHASKATDQITMVVRQCGGEDKARLLSHEADGSIRCLEAPASDPFDQPLAIPSDIRELLQHRLTIETVATEPSEANLADLPCFVEDRSTNVSRQDDDGEGNDFAFVH
jgi:hypothetical protein